MSAQTLSQPAWVGNLSVLQKAIYDIISKVIDKDHVPILLSAEAMVNYWAPAFTHKSVDATNNYEKLEFYGDKVLSYAFSSYIRQRFQNTLNQEQATLLLNQYMSKRYQPELARNLGLVELVRYNPEIPGVNVKVQEDIFESFFGAFSTITDDAIQPGLGYIYCFNLISDIFNEIEINPEAQKDPKSQLKEIFEGLKWGEPNYITIHSDDPSRGETKVEIRSITGEVIGVGYGSKKIAEFKAAENALNKLVSEGITAESVEKEKTRRARAQNPEFEKQYRRVEAAIVRLSQQAQAAGKTRVDRFKITRIDAQRVQGGYRYTFSIDVAYDSGQGRLTWRSAHQLTGSNPDQTKIDLMKTFADNYGIPANV